MRAALPLRPGRETNFGINTRDSGNRQSNARFRQRCGPAAFQPVPHKPEPPQAWASHLLTGRRLRNRAGWGGDGVPPCVLHTPPRARLLPPDTCFGKSTTSRQPTWPPSPLGPCSPIVSFLWEPRVPVPTFPSGRPGSPELTSSPALGAERLFTGPEDPQPG